MQADFYLLEQPVAQGRLKLVCRLASKLQKLEAKTLIVCDAQRELEQLDELLWTFSDASFVAHQVLSATPDQARPDRATHSASASATNEPGAADPIVSNTCLCLANHYAADSTTTMPQVLINLCAQIPPFYDQFERVVEIIDANEQSKQAGRQRFRQYQTNQVALKTHNISL